MRRIGSLVVALLVLAIAGGAAVVAADAPTPANGAPDVHTQESPPGEPANFYGTVADESGTDAPAGTTIVAVVDGEVEDRITVDTSGEYGNDGAFEEKLSLDSAAGETVRFRLGGVDGPEASQGSPHSLGTGTYEHDLTFPAGSFDDTDGEDDDGSGNNSDDDPGDDDPGDGGSQDSGDSSDDTEDSGDSSDDTEDSGNGTDRGTDDETGNDEESEDGDDRLPGSTADGDLIVLLTLTALALLVLAAGLLRRWL